MIITIITINLDNAAGLARTIGSVRPVKHPDIEYIVVDGASTDCSLDVIGANADVVDRWVSEPDGGIYQAMNKGARMARGGYCLFLNSGDFLLPGTDAATLLRRAAAGTDLVTYCEHRSRHPWAVARGSVAFTYVWRYSLSHNNTLIRRSLLERLGWYNEQYRIVSDWEFFLKALYLHQCSVMVEDAPFAGSEPAGISAREMPLHLRERDDVMARLFPHLAVDAETLLRYKLSRSVRLYDRIIKLLGR